MQPRLTVVEDIAFNGASPVLYVPKNEYSTLTLSGTDAANSTLQANSPYSLKTPNEISINMLSATVNGKKAVLDLTGIGHVYDVNSISGKVFLDENDNGAKDANEIYLKNAIVEIRSGTTLLETLLTDVNGNYMIQIPLTSCLEPIYSMTLSAPANKSYLLSTQNSNDFKVGGNLTNKQFNYLENFAHTGILTGKLDKDDDKGITSPSARTGDNTNVILISSIMLLSIGAFISIKKRKVN